MEKLSANQHPSPSFFFSCLSGEIDVFVIIITIIISAYSQGFFWYQYRIASHHITPFSPVKIGCRLRSLQIVDNYVIFYFILFSLLFYYNIVIIVTAKNLC